MYLWIRSQDKEFLMKVDNINLGIDVDTNEPNRLFTFVGGASTSFTLGTYKTRERAFEILDEISDALISANYMPLEENEKITCGSARVYKMPEE